MNCRIPLSRPARQFLLPVGLLMGSVFLAGCRDQPGADKPRTDVTLTITYDGKPVREGVVKLVDEQTGEGGAAALTVDGSASIPDVALGSYTVVVRPPEQTAPPLPPAPGEPAPQDDMGEHPDIPETFRQSETSPLTAEVTGGENHFEFDLKE